MTNRATISRHNSIATSLIAAALLFFVAAGCGSKDLKAVGPEYFGAWTGSDGSTMAIRGDGTGDYKSGGTSATGAKVGINEEDNTLNFNVFGMGPSLKIDKPPSGNQMTLGGVVYRKNSN